MKVDDERLTQSVRDAAKDANIGVNQAYEAIRRGEIPHIKIGKRILVLRKPWLKKLRGEDNDSTREKGASKASPAIRRAGASDGRN